MNKKSIGIVAGVLLFAIMLYLMLSGNSQGFDDGIRFWVYDHRTGVLTMFSKSVSFLASVYWIVALSLILLIWPVTRKRFGYQVAAGTIAITIVNNLIKHIVVRLRPDGIYWLVTEHGYSFPSGHSITSLYVYGLLVYLVIKNIENRQVRAGLVTLCTILLITVGPSRVYLGVHYPSDVLAGWGLGVAALAGTIWVIEYIEKRGKTNGNN